MEDSHIHDLPDCALEFCRAAGDTIPSFAQQKRPPLDRGGPFWGKGTDFFLGGGPFGGLRAPPHRAETPPPFVQKRDRPRGRGAAFLGKRDQFLMWMARFWTFSAHSRTDSETVG